MVFRYKSPSRKPHTQDLRQNESIYKFFPLFIQVLNLVSFIGTAYVFYHFVNTGTFIYYLNAYYSTFIFLFPYKHEANITLGHPKT